MTPPAADQVRGGDFMLGEHAGLIRIILQKQDEMAGDIGEIKSLLSERKGERKATFAAITVISSVVSFVIAFLLKVVPPLTGK